MAENHHSAQRPERTITPDELAAERAKIERAATMYAKPQVVFGDRGGWISGPSISLEDTQASDVRPGDRLMVTGESPVEVTDIKWGVYWMDDGYGPGIALGWRSMTGQSSGVLFRAGGDTLQRVV